MTENWDRVVGWMRQAVDAGIAPVTPKTWDAWPDRPVSTARVYQIVRRCGGTWPEAVTAAGGVARGQNRPHLWSPERVAEMFSEFHAENPDNPSIRRWHAWATEHGGPSHLTVRAVLHVEKWSDAPAAVQNVMAPSN